jgi:hypothetical protein
MVVQNFNKPLDKLTVNVHGIFIKSIVEVVSQLLVLGFPIGGVGQVILVEGMLEYVFWLYYVNRTASHLIEQQILYSNQKISTK